jgi:hypothetical protein
MIFFGSIREPKRLRRHDSVTRETAWLRATTDHLWRSVFIKARQDIDDAAAHGARWVIIRVLQPCDDDMAVEVAATLAHGAARGFPNMRPGSPAGTAADFLRLEASQ